MSGLPTYNFTLSIGYSGAEHEGEFTIEEFGYNLDEWSALGAEEREKVIWREWTEWTNNYIDGGPHLIEN